MVRRFLGLNAHMYTCHYIENSPLSLSLSLSPVVYSGALGSALSTDSSSSDTDLLSAAEVRARTRTPKPDLREAALALYVAIASAVSAHGRLVAITFLTEHLVALC